MDVFALIENGFSALIDVMAAVLFYPILGIPFLVLWLATAGIFFTLRLGFLNIRLFLHALSVVKGCYASKMDKGEITPFQALVTAISSTVGLGNIAGVAVAVVIGGPGAVIWMMIAGLFGMSTKFAEVTLGQKYRKFHEDGSVSGGAFYYLRDGLADIGLSRLGKILSVMFTICLLGGMLGGGNMVQSNQAVAILTDIYPVLAPLKWVIALSIAAMVGIVIIGGIKRIAQVAQAVVPSMAVLYVAGCIAIIIANISAVPAAITLMFESAFNLQAAGGGMLGALIVGFQRATFSNEAGVGTAPIAHAAAKTSHPVRQGCVALLEPFIDTVIICFMTGIMITVTGVYLEGTGKTGVTLASASFATVIDWFPYVLSVCVTLFAYSTIITSGYYGEKAWAYLFGRKHIRLFQLLFCTGTFLGGVFQFGMVLTFSDLVMIAMAIPNVIGLYLMHNMISAEVSNYRKMLK